MHGRVRPAVRSGLADVVLRPGASIESRRHHVNRYCVPFTKNHLENNDPRVKLVAHQSTVAHLHSCDQKLARKS